MRSRGEAIDQAIRRMHGLEMVDDTIDHPGYTYFSRARNEDESVEIAIR